MAVELHRLMEKVSHMDISLLAGKQGMDNLVSWVHMVETTEASTFLEGREITFITGIGISKEEELFDLIKEIFEKQVAGIIINTGPFISSISDEIIDFCNQKNLPLFVVPWKVHLAEIMRIFAYTITKDDQKIFETASAFKNAIFFPKQEELYLVPLSQRNFPANWSYLCTVFKLVHSKDPLTHRVEELTQSMENYLQHHYHNYAIFSHDSDILLVLGNYTQTDARKCIADLNRYTSSILRGSEELFMGAGRNTQSIRCLYKSFHQALAICKLQQKHTIDRHKVFYSQMGVYRLLMGVEDPTVMKEYYEQTLAPLIEYDKTSDSDLVNVLKTYFEHNGSVKETADHLYVHRNTINYKLTKIAELLDADLSSLEIRTQLMIAFKLYDIL